MHLARMDSVTFQTLSDERLGWHCMEPAFGLSAANRLKSKQG